MKINLNLLKFLIRLIILLIMLVMLFIISVFLYSAKFWPDIHNYINANITIKRIPTISELNTVVIEVEFTTEMHSTTAMDYEDSSTVEDFLFNFDDFSNDDVETKRRKRQIPIEEMKTNFEVIKANYDDVFDFEVTTNVIKDLVNEDKLTKTDSKDVEMILKTDDCIKDAVSEYDGITHVSNQVSRNNGIEAIFPWIATLFIKNYENNQFMYICDGSLVSNRVVLTAARCLTKGNVTEDVKDILVILGKRSLQAMGPNEKVIRVKSIKLHENFTEVDGKFQNDLAIIVLDDVIAANDDIHPTDITQNDGNHGNSSEDESATTGWHTTGAITPIYFEEGSKGKCASDSNDTFCAVFGDSITTCPSFGGAFVSRNNTQWRLQGISTGAPTSSGVCFSKKVIFTNISHYYKWIKDHINRNK